MNASPRFKDQYRKGLSHTNGYYRDVHSRGRPTFGTAFDEIVLLEHLFVHAIADTQEDIHYQRFLYGRRFAILLRGGVEMLALVPPSACIGDEMVWAMDDIQVPYVVRPRQVDQSEAESISATIQQFRSHSYEVAHYDFVGEGGLMMEPSERKRIRESFRA